jgi:hypothetical protein
MKVIRAALAELIGMFIDAGSLALGLVVLIAAVTLAVKMAGIGPSVGGFTPSAASFCRRRESIGQRGRNRRRKNKNYGKRGR